MFFAASKILAFLIQPLHWLLALLLVIIFAKKPHIKKRAGMVALLLLVLGSNRALLNLVAGYWELSSPPLDRITVPYDVGILLGGFANAYGWPNDGRLHLNASANRFTQALELYQQGKIKKILITGGWGRLTGPQTIQEARAAKAFLIQFGIPATDIILEQASRNTWENAEFTHALLQKTPEEERCLLITSAWHMRRSLACFQKAGLQVDYYAVDHIRNQPQWWWQDVLSFKIDVLMRWEWLIKEWIGVLAYTLKGYN